MTQTLADRVREAWTLIAGIDGASFSFGPTVVSVCATSRVCPPGWVGIVAIEDAFLAVAPSERDAGLVRSVLDSIIEQAPVSPSVVAERLPANEVLGPAYLSYRDDAPTPAVDPVESVASDDRDFAQLLASVDAEEAEESGLAHITSRAFVARDGRTVVAAAGYQHWRNGVAHLCVLTAPSARGQGLAGTVASAAAADAVERAGLLPQWRARPAASRRVAARLGFRELGWQLSLKLEPHQ